MDADAVDVISAISPEQRSHEILVYLRKIFQAISMHSKDLNRRYGLTGPQLVILNEISSRGRVSVSQLARSISLTQATVTDILNRLEKKGMVIKGRSERDKRMILIMPTEACARLLQKVPPPLQQTFTDRFADLAEWEQMMILSALRRVVDLMFAEKFEAAPILTSDFTNP